MSTNPRGQITLESLEEPNEVPYLRMDSKDALVRGGAAVIGFQGVSALGGGPVLATAVAVVLLIVAHNYVKSAPPYCNSVEWTRILLKYARQPDEYTTAKDAYIDTTNSLYAAVKTDEDTMEKTKVKRFYPPFGIVERTDGTYYMVIRYEPPNLDFAPGSKFKRIAGQIEQWVNDSGDFGLTFHVTGEPVNMQAYFDNLTKRAFDDDIKTNEVFKSVVDGMRRYRRQQLAASQTEEVQFYFIVKAEEDDVSTGATNDESASDRSGLFRMFSGDESEEEESEEELKRQMEEKLRRRADSIQRGIGGEITGASSEIVSASHAAGVLQGYWKGENEYSEYDDADPETEPIPMSRFADGEATKTEEVTL